MSRTSPAEDDAYEPAPWRWNAGHISTLCRGSRVILIADEGVLKTRDPRTGVLVPVDPTSPIGQVLVRAPELAENLSRCADSLANLISELIDPGSEALAALYCAREVLARVGHPPGPAEQVALRDRLAAELAAPLLEKAEDALDLARRRSPVGSGAEAAVDDYFAAKET